jgi:hypothetical protein
MFIVVGPDRPIDLNAAQRPERVSRVHSGMVPTTTKREHSWYIGPSTRLERRLRGHPAATHTGFKGSKKPQNSTDDSAAVHA